MKVLSEYEEAASNRLQHQNQPNEPQTVPIERMKDEFTVEQEEEKKNTHKKMFRCFDF